MQPGIPTQTGPQGGTSSIGPGGLSSGPGGLAASLTGGGSSANGSNYGSSGGGDYQVPANFFTANSTPANPAVGAFGFSTEEIVLALGLAVTVAYIILKR